MTGPKSDRFQISCMRHIRQKKKSYVHAGNGVSVRPFEPASKIICRGTFCVLSCKTQWSTVQEITCHCPQSNILPAKTIDLSILCLALEAAKFRVVTTAYCTVKSVNRRSTQVIISLIWHFWSHTCGSVSGLGPPYRSGTNELDREWTRGLL